MNTTAPVTLSLSTPEMWLALQCIGAVPPDAPTPPEVASPDELRDAEQAMLARKHIQTDADGTHRLAVEVELLVRPVAFPDAVCVATLTDARSGNPARTICFSRAAQRFVMNWVDDTQLHHLHMYTLETAASAAWQHLASVCDTGIDEPKTSGSASIQTVERAMKQTQQTVLLMCILDVQSAEQRSSALSWFVSEQTAWLIEQQESDQLPQRISRNHLSDVVQTFIGQILD